MDPRDNRSRKSSKPEEWLTVGAIAERLKMDVEQVRELVASPRIRSMPAKRHGKQCRAYAFSEVQAALAPKNKSRPRLQVST